MNKSVPPGSMLQHNAAEILDGKYPKVSYIIEGVLRKGITGIIAGDGGIGKTSFCTQLAAAVATGHDFLGGVCEIKSRGKVAFFQHEEDDELKNLKLSPLLDQYINDHSEMPKDQARKELLAHLRENFLSPDIRGKGVCLVTSDSRGDFAPTQFYQKMLFDLKSAGDIQLVIIDPLQSFYAGDEMNSAKAAYFIRLLDRIAVETGATVLIASHVSQASQTGQYANPFHQSAVRGATAFVNASRFVLAIAGPDKDFRKLNATFPKEECLQCQVVKSNYGPCGEKYIFHRERDGFLTGVVDDGGYKNFADDVFKFIDSHRGEFAVTPFLDGPGKTIREEHGISKRNAKAFLERMVAERKLLLEDRRAGTKTASFMTTTKAVCLFE